MLSSLSSKGERVSTALFAHKSVPDTQPCAAISCLYAIFTPTNMHFAETRTSMMSTELNEVDGTGRGGDAAAAMAPARSMIKLFSMNC